MILGKIYRELVGIRKELHNIRNAMEPKTIDTDLIMREIAEELKKSFSAMKL